MVRTRLFVALFAALLLVSCSKKEPVKSAEQQKAELDQATKTTRENTVWGEQVKALDKAKDAAAVMGEATTKTEDALKKADEQK